jgi:hypothetical protein
VTCGVTPNALWHRCSHVESRRAKCSNAPAVRAESGLGETTTWSAPYANWYANHPDSGGVRGCTPTYVKRSDLQELDTHEHRRTHCLNLGVKWSQVQILSARPLKWPLSCENGRVAHHRRQCVEGSLVRLPMSSTCRLIRSCPNGRAHSVGIGVVSVVALIHVLVEVIAITNGASPSGAPCGVVRTVPYENSGNLPRAVGVSPNQRHLMPHPIDGRWSGSTGRPASTASTAARTSAAVTGRSFRGRESSSWPR